MKNDGIKEQFVLTISRLNQATAVIRAISLSSNPSHQLLQHLYSTQYITIIVDVNKLFDKSRSATNLQGLIKLYKNTIKHDEYEEAIKSIKEIREKYKTLLETIESLRHNIAGHLNKVTLKKMYQDPFSPENEVNLNEVQSLLAEIIDFMKSLSFVNEKESQFLSNRIGPKDVMDLLGLKINQQIQQQIQQQILKDFGGKL